MVVAPFKFLDSYTKEDSAIFFGRDREIEELYYKVFESSLLVVYGSSGTGKTSLIQCGLANKFNDADWQPIIVRRGNDINESLKKTLQNIALTPLKKKFKLPQDIQSVYLDYFKPMFLIFDQFEELFIFGSEEEIELFVDQIKASLEANLSCRFVFVIRGEYLENLARFEDKIPDFFNNRMRIEKMTRKNAYSVITEPAKLFNIRLAEDFHTKFLEKLSSHKATIELTYLQVYLDKLYKRAISKSQDNPVFDNDLLLEAGKIDNVLAEFLEEQISKTQNPEEAMMVLKAFVSNEGTKKQMTAADVSNFFQSLGKQLSFDEAEKYILQFVDLRILKDKDEDGKYELRHDALAGKIFDHITIAEKELMEVKQFISNRYRDFKLRGVYLEKSDIKYITPSYSKLVLEGDEKKFVDTSIKLSRKKETRNRNIVIILVSSIIFVLSCATIFALLQRNDAIQQSLTAIMKTKEAQKAKEAAEEAKLTSENEERKALEAKSYAELQKNKADSSAIIALEQTQIATLQRNFATEKSKQAENAAVFAIMQKDTAEIQKLSAEIEKDNANAAKLEANRLRMISASQSVAFKSLQGKKDPKLSALLSLTAYRLAYENKGNTFTPELYNALFMALKNLSPYKMPPSQYPLSIKTTSNTGAISNAGKDGNFCIWQTDGILNTYSKENKLLSSKQFNVTKLDKTNRSSIFEIFNFSKKAVELTPNKFFLSKDGQMGLTAYEDYSIYIWDMHSGKASNNLICHSGLVRAVAFAKNGEMVVTGGRDSNIIFWNKNVVAQKIKCPSIIKTLELSANENILHVGCENGCVYKYNLYSKTNEELTCLGGRIQSILCRNNQDANIIVATSQGEMNIYSSDAKYNTINESSGIEFVGVYNDDFLIDVTNENIIHVYNMKALLDPPIEIQLENSVQAFYISSDGYIVIASNKNLIKYPIYTKAMYQLLLSEIETNLTSEEWNTYIGRDIRYFKLK